MIPLFILALPRSLSSLIYHLSRGALGLKEPAWTTDGEILNLDRHVLYRGDRRDQSLKFLVPRHAPALADQITLFLSQTVAEGFAYKDVCHPFICASWRGLAALRVLRIRRPLADIAASVLDRGWQYPAHAIRRVDPGPDDVLRGLLLAERALDGVSAGGIGAVDVRYDDLVRREGALYEALEALYPEAPVRRLPYMDAAFCMARDRQLARRQTPAWRALAARLERLSAEMDKAEMDNPEIGDGAGR